MPVAAAKPTETLAHGVQSETSLKPANAEFVLRSGDVTRGQEKQKAEHQTGGQQAQTQAGGQQTHTHEPLLVRLGYIAALILATVCIGCSILHLNTFTNIVNDGMKVARGLTQHSQLPLLYAMNGANFATARLMLMSCGVSAGLMMGILGFALYLMGVRGSINAEGGSKDVKVVLTQLSPGAFTMACAAALIAFSISRPITYQEPVQQNGANISVPSTGVKPNLKPTGAGNGSAATNPATTPTLDTLKAAKQDTALPTATEGVATQ